MGLGDKFNDAKDKAQDLAGQASEKLGDFAGNDDNDNDNDKGKDDKDDN